MSAVLITDPIRREFEPGGCLEILGRKQVADEIGVSNSNLDSVRGLPKPVTRISSGPVWLAADIRSFARARGAARTTTTPRPEEAV